jgi:LPXTG-motif cell wall-anchored protein
MRVSVKRGRFAAAGGGVVLLVCSLLSFAPTAGSQEPGEPVDLRGFATSQPAHVSALEAGGTRVADAEVAWSSAAVDADADGLKGAKLNEMNRIFQPDKAGKMSYARGSGLEVGLATTPADPNQVILTALAEADAAPSSDALEEIAVEGLDPVAYASLVRGQAVANANESGLVPDVCVLGDDISRGHAFAADAQLLDAGGDTASPQLDGPVIALDDQPNPGDARSVSQSTSRMKLVPGGGANVFGLMAEVRQTIAPVTLLRADPTDVTRTITIEVLGEWVLRVVANGKSGGASVFYGPGEVSPQTSILRIIDSDNAVSDILSFQDLFGDEGFTALNIPGVLDLTIGEDPRAIAAPGQDPDPASKPALAANGTSASAAADVVRVQLLSQPDPQAADIRVGHMEVSAAVPTGGVTCPIPVTKSADPDNIKINEEPDTATIEIEVENAYDCDLVDVVLVDRIRQQTGSPDFRLAAAEPAPDSPTVPSGVLTSADVTWSLGEIKKGESKTVSLDLQSAGSGGILRDIAEASGTFANCVGQDAEGLAIAGLDLSGLSVPVDVAVETPVTGAQAAQTVATGGGLTLAAAGLGLLLRRRKK